MTSAPVIRAAATADAAACAAIFAHYALHTCATLQEEPLPEDYFSALIKKANPAAPFLVVEDDNKICGYAYADIFRSRCGYRYTVEASIYLTPEHTGKGIGDMLMPSLLGELAKSDMRVVISLVTMPNLQSVKLHEKHGFAPCGILPGVGWKFNALHDVGMWIKQLR